LSLSLLAANAEECTGRPTVNMTANTKGQSRFTCIPENLRKISTYGMIINFQERVRFIHPILDIRPISTLQLLR
jgi:hypothetical protein